MKYRVGDKVRIPHTEIVGVVRSITDRGFLGVDWDDGELTPDAGLHPDDVEKA